MSLRLLLPMTVLAVLTAAVFSPNLRADDGVVTMSKAPYYYATQGAKRQSPNPTYWTWMPCPLHGGCDTCWSHRCPSGKGFWTFPAVRWALDPNYYAVAPDYGWAPPDKAAIRRNYVRYTQYHPATWYGAAANSKQQYRRYPIIGQPTDTAQMGYNYQQVPQWQPRPAMIPGTPDPRNWHWRPTQPGKDGSRMQWVRLNNAWVPLDQIPGRSNPMPMPKPVPTPMPQKANPTPVPAPPVDNKAAGPQALKVPVDGSNVRQVGLAK
jgi:hypothetical protein